MNKLVLSIIAVVVLVGVSNLHGYTTKLDALKVSRAQMLDNI